MVVRHLIPGLVFFGLSVASAFSAETTLATHPALTFFSSISEEPLARLEAESIGPRFVKHGPFEMPAPGVNIESPTLTLHDQPCTNDDWARVLEELGRWQKPASGIQLLLTLPDGSAVVFQRPPSARSGTLSGFVRPLNPEKGKPAEARLLRISHDGKDRLRIDLRAISSAAARTSRLVLAEPEPASAAPLPSESPVPAETVASP